MPKKVTFTKKLATAATQRLKRELRLLLDSKIISSAEAARLKKAFLSELNAEKERFIAFAKKELSSGLKKAKRAARPIVKRAVKKLLK